MPSGSYDPTTDLGKIRFLIADTDVMNFVWDDSEINAAIGRFGNSKELAAAWIMESAASDAAKLAFISRTDSTNTDLTKIAENLRARAKELRAISIVVPAIQPVTPSFVMNNDAIGLIGNMGGGSPGVLNW